MNLRTSKVPCIALFALAFECAQSFFPNSGAAQLLGIAALLNPEGSRLFPQPILFPRHSGKPDPRWRAFNWRLIDDVADSSKFRLYFYEEEDWSARFVLPKIHEEVISLAQTFAFAPPIPFNYLLFTSEREFRQANIFDISEGVQGITSTEEATMAIPFWGEQQTFDHISTHEMVHQFQVQKIRRMDEAIGAQQMQFFPLWFIEGMAEYYSLHGIDAESRVFLRDLAIHPNLEKDYTPPGFFEEGPLNFINIYKCGQAKIAFLEAKFGKNTVQTLLARGSLKIEKNQADFRTFVASQLHKSAAIIESEWKTWFISQFQKEADQFTQAVLQNKPSFKEVAQAGDNLDLFDLSPDGRWMAIREIDPLTGIVSIQLIDLSIPKKEKIKLKEDHEPGALSLYFFQNPTLAISNQNVGFIVETSFGPQLEIHDINHPDHALGVPLYKWNILQTQSLAFSPDGKSIGFIGVTPAGASNIYVIDSFSHQELPEIRQITHEHYSWRNLSWDNQGLLVAGDRTANGKFALFHVDVTSGNFTQITHPKSNQGMPTALENGLLFQSWDAGPNGSPQASILYNEKEGASKRRSRKLTRLTDLKTGVFYPKIRHDQLYFMAFEGGRYHLVTGQPVDFGSQESLVAENDLPWVPKLDPLLPSQIQKYRPFISSGKRLDGLGAFLASGGYFGLGATVSDLMRDYSLTADLLVLGDIKRTTADVFISSYRGRTKWTLGAYRAVIPQLDSLFPPTSGTVRTFLYKEFGVLGQVEYPFTAFSYTDLELRLGGANRTDFSDPAFNDLWLAQNPGSEFVMAPTFRLGYDGIVYELFSGPLKGFGTLFEADTSYTPSRQAIAERLRLDIAHYFHLPGRTVFALQGLGAAAFGDRFRQSFLISSDDILRSYPFNDDRLYGNYVLAGKAELRFPIGQIFGFPPLRGLAAYDLGSVFTDGEDSISKVSSSVSLGLTLNIPPISINFLGSHPLREAPGPADSSVAHFTLRYLYL